MTNLAVRIGTRGSALALKQTGEVATALQTAYPSASIAVTVITTTGDRVTDVPLSTAAKQDAGLFTSALERALLAGEVDLAVHSLKDLPTGGTPGLTVGAIPVRAHPADVLVSRAGYTLATLPHGATVGSSSGRRAAQLLRRRPDLKIIDIRGNIDTRLKKALDADGPYDAIVLAHAGLARLERLDVVSEVLLLDAVIPAPGQAALAVQCRDETFWRDLVRPLHDADTADAVNAERAFLSGLGGGCALPVAAYGIAGGGRLALAGEILSPDGQTRVYVEGTFDRAAPQAAGEALAREALLQGGLTLLERYA